MTILETLTSKKGQFSRAIWHRACKVRAGSPAITKITVATVRAGIEYDNKASVIEKRENGELPKENAGLPWGEWEQYPYLIQHKGIRYARLYPTANSNTLVEYRMDNRVITYDDALPHLLASEHKKTGSEKPECITVKLNDIIELY